MRFGRMLALGVDPRADQLDRRQAALLAQPQTTPQLQLDATMFGIVKARLLVRRAPGLLIFAAEVGAEDRMAASPAVLVGAGQSSQPRITACARHDLDGFAF